MLNEANLSFNKNEQKLEIKFLKKFLISASGEPKFGKKSFLLFQLYNIFEL